MKNALLISLLLVSFGLFGQMNSSSSYRTVAPYLAEAAGGFDWSNADHNYDFNQTTSTLTDNIGTDNGTVSVTYRDSSGILNGAFYLDGINDVITFSTGNSPGSGNVSISGWVKIHDDTDTEFWCGGTDNGAMAFGHIAGGLVLAESGAGTISTATSSITLTQNVWHHVVAVYDNASANNVTFYIDGVSEVESFSYNFTLATTIFGARKTGVSGYYRGLMDEWTWFVGYLLSSDEVDELYNGGTGIEHE
jgi:hypothetical protein